MMSSYSPPSSPAVSEISVGSPSPPPPRKQLHAHIAQPFLPIHKRLKVNGNHEQKERSTNPRPVPKLNAERVKSFSIADILGHDSKNQENNVQHPPTTPRFDYQNDEQPTKIVRPWDHLRDPIPVRPFLPPALLHFEHRLALDYQRQLQEHFHAQAQLLRQMTMDIIPSESGSERSSSAASDRCSPEIGIGANNAPLIEKSSQHLNKNECDTRVANSNAKGSQKEVVGTPLDALFQMATKDFNETQDQSHLDLFSTRPTPKKKRKSRTAFTNHQIFELEKRFLYQKYLSPADRDEIAGGLGLSNSQVITWFQNRRAKLKRDMEELKKDVESVNALSAHKSFLENVNDLSILKRSPIITERSSDSSESSLSTGNQNFTP